VVVFRAFDSPLCFVRKNGSQQVLSIVVCFGYQTASGNPVPTTSQGGSSNLSNFLAPNGTGAVGLTKTPMGYGMLIVTLRH